MNKENSLSRLTGVGEKVYEKLASLGLATVGDLINHYPHRYDDFSQPTPIDQLSVTDSAIIKGRILAIENDLSPRQRMKLTKALVADATGQITIVWFNQPFLIRVLKEGTEWLFAGKVERSLGGQRSMVSPVVEREPKIVPIYPETAGLTSKMIRKLVYQVRPFIQELPDWLPDEVRLNQQLPRLADAYEFIHFPESMVQVETGRQRLALDELTILIAQLRQAKNQLEQLTAPECPYNIDRFKEWVAALPFQLTDSQRKAIWQIIQDLAQEKPMNRLLEGDVGSGKTVVALLSSLVVIAAGYRAVWLAPTEVLAVQHYQTVQKLLGSMHMIRAGLLTGQTSKIMQQELDRYDLIIGTHAVIQDKVTLDRLGLVIVDEQHRFGVDQRTRLTQQTSLCPHFLAMTATPIPRTLALTLYGDLDIARLESVPTGRLPVITRLVSPAERDRAYQFIRSQVKAGHQIFVVCPYIDPSNPAADLDDTATAERKAALAEYEKLQKKVFPDLRVGLLHGRMKSADKQAVMKAFQDKELDILVSTAVIEVGVDIPNATVMVLEDAERFGLAQLHQFRGRVGRSHLQSYCFVFTSSDNPLALERLKAFTETRSGFELAELDLRLRGPGQLLGLRQAGLGDLKLADLSDIAQIEQAREVVNDLFARGLQNDPNVQERISHDGAARHLG